MQCDSNTLSIVDELLADKSIENTICKRLSETRGITGTVTHTFKRLSGGIGKTLTGMTGKMLLAIGTGLAVWMGNQLIQKWLISSKVKGKHFKIIQDSYEPMIRDVLRALQPALTASVQKVSEGQVVDARRIVAKEKAKILRIVDGHFMQMVKTLRADVHQSILDDVSSHLEEALANHVPQALNNSDLHGDQQSVHF